jgi:hypothetical protein
VIERIRLLLRADGRIKHCVEFKGEHGLSWFVFRWIRVVTQPALYQTFSHLEHINCIAI